MEYPSSLFPSDHTVQAHMGCVFISHLWCMQWNWYAMGDCSPSKHGTMTPLHFGCVFNSIGTGPSVLILELSTFQRYDL